MSRFNTKTLSQIIKTYSNTRDFLVNKESNISDIKMKVQCIDFFMSVIFLIWSMEKNGVIKKLFLMSQLEEYDPNQNLMSFSCFLIDSIEKLFLIADSSNYFTKEEFNILKQADLPLSCFYISKSKKTDGILSQNIEINNIEALPLFNLLEYLDSSFGAVNEYILGKIFEFLLSKQDLRKKFGIYYTPKQFTDYMSKLTIENYFIDQLNIKFDIKLINLSNFYEKLDLDVANWAIHILKTLKILDLALGTGQFLISAIYQLLEIHEHVRNFYRDKGLIEVLIQELELQNDTFVLENFRNIEDDNFFKCLVINKLIIPRNLYGVDINFIAVQIAKIRCLMIMVKFFSSSKMRVSLLAKMNHNLKQGNALLGYLACPNDREVSYTSLNQLNLDYISQFGIESISENDFPLFHWFYEFKDVFIQNSKFQVILTNPPYIGESGNKKLFRLHAKALSEYYEGKADLWYYFLHRSINLLSENGYCTFIAPNYWITASGASLLRSRLSSETTFVRYINFNQNSVFNSAQGVHINILTVKKGINPEQNFECTVFNDVVETKELIKSLPDQQTFILKQNELLFNGWDPYFHFIPRKYRIILEFIISKSYKLKNKGFYVKEGIITGMNTISGRQISRYNLSPDKKGIGVFILDVNHPEDEKYIQSLSEIEKSILKPFYKNSDIKRYYSAFNTSRKIQYLNRNTINIVHLPRVRYFLEQFKEILNDSLDNPPYLNRPRDPFMFVSPKIITPQRSNLNRFAYNSLDWFAGQDVYYILNEKNDKNELKTLLLILNSKLAYYWFYWMGKRKGKQLELFSEPLGYFPIPDLKGNDLHILADYLLFLNLLHNESESARITKLLAFFNRLAELAVFEFYFSELCYKKGFSETKYPFSFYIQENLKELNFDVILENFKENYDSNRNFIILSDQIEVIEEAYYSLKTNEDIKSSINKINTFPMVKTIAKFSSL
ncbi:MAG: hypothetical protein EAX86_01585 [Candidatus Heimdallarchaeota archaeon]|nr:hypothetical protein [Candidatus Heimdallarchaeota archaeon]